MNEPVWNRYALDILLRVEFYTEKKSGNEQQLL